MAGFAQQCAGAAGFRHLPGTGGMGAQPAWLMDCMETYHMVYLKEVRAGRKARA